MRPSSVPKQRAICDAKAPAARILIVAIGVSEGAELRSTLELARGLEDDQECANEVTIATHATHRALIESVGGLAFVAGGLDPHTARRETESGQALEMCKSDPLAAGAALNAFLVELVGDWYSVGVELLSEGIAPSSPSSSSSSRVSFDMVVLASTAAVFTYSSILEELDVAAAIFDVSPLVPTAAFPPPKGFSGVESSAKARLGTASYEDHSMRWVVYLQSVWRFLFRDGVTAARMRFGHSAATTLRHSNVAIRGNEHGIDCLLGPWAPIFDGAGGPGAVDDIPIIQAYAEEILPLPPNTVYSEKKEPAAVSPESDGIDGITATLLSAVGGSTSDGRGERDGTGARKAADLVIPPSSTSLLPLRPWGSHVHVVGPCLGALGPLPEGDLVARCLPDRLRAFLAADLSKPVVFLDFGAVGDTWASSAARHTLLLQCLEAFTVAKVGAVAIAAQ